METITHYIGGIFGGITWAILSHPFDTIRVRLQTNPEKYNYSIKECIKQTHKENGIKTFYKGLASPIIGIGFEKSIVFGTYNFVKKQIKIKNEEIKNVISGSIAGLSASFIVTPIEAIKINQQISKMNIITTIKELHCKKMLFRGLSSTMTREMPGFGIYFGIYNYKKKEEYSKKTAFMRGAISGSIAWLFIYPQDVIKSRTQDINTKYASMIDCIKSMKNRYGYRIFYKGFSIALLRAIPLHGGAFLGYEMYINNL